ncbi:MAG: hypothetical protein GY788_31320 [bacterium]|nr:hypothetical protein [bacterium]
MAAGITVFGALASTTPLVVAVSGVCLALIIILLWRTDDPPVLFIPALFQWSEVAILPLSTTWRDVPLFDLSFWGVEMETAALFGFGGVTALAIGLRLGAGRSRGNFAARLRAETETWRFRDVATIAFAAIGVGYAFAFMTGYAGPLRELFNQASNLKYVGLFALTYWCLLTRTRYTVLGAVMAFEVVGGMTGFFEGFKFTILTLLVAALAARPQLRPRDVLVVTLAGAVLLAAGVFWSAIKPDYRKFLNQDTGEQVVLQSLDGRLDYLADAASSIDGEMIAEGFDLLVARHGYIEFLALTMQNVPSVIPHENGGMTGTVFQHIAMPRFLFPDKAALPNDTEVMSYYTGLPMMWGSNTSISIGYLGELYIDFGYFGLGAAFVIGSMAGFVYRVLRSRRDRSALIAAGLCLMVAFPLAYFGTAYAKMIGSFVFSSVIALGMQKFGVPIVLPILLGRRRFRRTDLRSSG